jgi:hypothetical protein
MASNAGPVAERCAKKEALIGREGPRDEKFRLKIKPLCGK